jgi:cytochrome b6-f complex iron-sulfur subunit
MLVAIAFVVVALLAVVAVMATRPPVSPRTGRLSRETRRHDCGSVAPASAPPRRALERPAVPVPVPRPSAPPPPRVPPDGGALGVTRRKFLNRSLRAAGGLGRAAFGSVALSFLWPSAAAGFGGKIAVGTTADVATAEASKQPYYNATAKTYIVPYPKSALPKARKIPAYAPILAGMEAGYVALYQTCPHLGCRRRGADVAGFGACHGRNEGRGQQGGPAPGYGPVRVQISGGNIVVDTGDP